MSIKYAERLVPLLNFAKHIIFFFLNTFLRFNKNPKVCPSKKKKPRL